MALEPKWLVFYTRARAEKKTLEYLKKAGFEAYLPLVTQIRQWSDRKKKVEVPLFNSYIFVLDNESKIPDILKVPGISWNIRHNGQPAELRQEELDTIKMFIETGLLIETNDAEFLKIGDQVEIMGGPLRGMVGILRSDYSETKFSVMVDTMDQVLTINLDKNLLKFVGSGDKSSEENYWDKL